MLQEKQRPRRASEKTEPLAADDLEIVPFNPLQPNYIAEIASQELLGRDCYPLSNLPRFKGAGVYAIYYHGDSPYYQPISRANQIGCRSPIYVGKADPPGARRGTAVSAPGYAVYNRLKQHADSIRQAYNPGTPGHLDINNFKVRFLVMDPIWIGMTESLSISKFKPPWNGYIDGFGHHDQGATRRTQERSKWDTLHPGRPWATHFKQNPLSIDEIARGLAAYFANPDAFRSLPRKRGPSHLETDQEIPIEVDEVSEDDQSPE